MFDDLEYSGKNQVALFLYLIYIANECNYTLDVHCAINATEDRAWMLRNLQVPGI